MSDAGTRRRVGALPPEPTSLVGRSGEVAEVKRLLRTFHLVTVTGVGGVGKTRVALRAAAELQPEFSDGVCLVQLSAVRSHALVPHVVAAALELQDQTTRPMADVLADYLADQQLLLVLDTCEGLVDPCAELTVRLCAAAPRLRVLVTSRQRLAVPVEQVLVVPPLPLPGHDDLRPGPSRTGNAVDLFVQRAAAITPNFTLSAGYAQAVAALCRRLDGIPLAIELAAAQSRGLSPEAILYGLDHRFELLSSEDPVGTARHRTLRLAIGWSHELCTPAERLLWARASVFPADFDLDAVEAVGADEQLPRAAIDGLVAQLVDKSILLTGESEAGIRYHMLDTVRDYGREWLEALGETREVRRRHRDYYLGVTRQARDGWTGGEQLLAFIRAEREHANFRAGLDFSLATPGEAAAGLELAGTLWFYWSSCGYLSEGRRWLDSALALVPERGPVRMRGLWASGAVAVSQGDNASATRMLEECRADALRADDRQLVGWALLTLGTLLLWDDDYAGAERLFDDGIRALDSLAESDALVPMGRTELAFAVGLQGDLIRAEALAEEARNSCAKHGEQWALGHVYYVLAVLAFARGEHSQAIGHALDCLRQHHSFHNLVGIAMVIELLAQISVAGGAAERAATLHGVARLLWRALGKRLFGSAAFEAQHQACEALARQLIGEQSYETAYRRGTEFELEEAIAYALAT